MIYETRSDEFIFQFKVELQSDMEKVWKYVSDTERSNRILKEPPFTYTNTPDSRGGSITHGIQKNTGFTFRFIERSPEWVVGKYFQIVREYSAGPFKRFIQRVDLNEVDGKIEATNTLRIIMRWKILNPITFFRVQLDALPRYKKYFQSIDTEPDRKYNIGITELKKEISDEALEAVLNKFQLITKNKNLAYRIANFLLMSQDLDLLKIRPYRIAKVWNVNKKEVLEIFLRGTKAGFFDMNWDILCPSCRGAKSTSHSLAGMEMTAHCSSCNIDYTADFDKSVELTFTPNASIREVYGGVFCSSSPNSTPHQKVQVRVDLNKTEEFSYFLSEGIYKIYSLHTKGILTLQVDSTGSAENSIFYDGNLNNEIHLKPGETKFSFANKASSEEIVVKLERADWLEDIVTASEVTSFHEFRELFSTEVLRPGEEIGIKNLSILFTDLKGSTQFYNTKGDAFAYKAVSSHFEILIRNIQKYDGAIVKTIGDAIMGIFLLPINAVLYSIQIQKEIADLNKKEYGGEKLIILKIGIHAGPVLAVNQNDKLDYFGKTVNMAARVEGKCNGGDIVITKSLYENEKVKELITSQHLKIEMFESDMKGFEGSSELVRIIL
jgi:adenylate cyclase